MTIILYAYLAITAVIAARAAWDMVFRLDDFDWRFGDIWWAFFFMLLLWPLLLLKPLSLMKLLRSPFTPIDSSSPNLAARERELYQLGKNPPPCGKTVRFHSHEGAQEDAGALLTFPAEAVEEALVATTGGVCDPDILLWINRRQPDLEVTDVPKPWWRFRYIAANLIEKGYGVVQCKACGQRTPGSALRKETISVIGHGIARWGCNCGAVLLSIDTVHIR
ncbi:hypothetical protein [Thauera humireducens]|uniref:hypothetical protein n=1 Tax=Thauera humireducens TaxID=1134435 RepID=UPI0024A9D74F|nr:hypothetical protein [Thauera humireducens]